MTHTTLQYFLFDTWTSQGSVLFTPPILADLAVHSRLTGPCNVTVWPSMGVLELGQNFHLRVKAGSTALAVVEVELNDFHAEQGAISLAFHELSCAGAALAQGPNEFEHVPTDKGHRALGPPAANMVTPTVRHTRTYAAPQAAPQAALWMFPSPWTLRPGR